jgi:uncharacterized protein
MKHAKIDSVYVIRLERGERIVESLTRFCRQKKIKAASFQGIGTCRRAELGFFQMRSCRYNFRTFPQDFEITSLLGNVSLSQGRPFIHAHIVLGGSGYKAKTGHLKEAEVLATCEIVLVPMKGTLPRKLDRASGLSLLDFHRNK